jgi:hypothetical protein
MGFEKELVPVVERISRRSRTIEEAVSGVETALRAGIGEATLLLQPEGDRLSPFSIQSVSSFLNSRTFPFRGVYTAHSRAGKLIACFGAFGEPGRFLQELTDRIAAELGALHGRVQHREVA